MHTVGSRLPSQQDGLIAASGDDATTVKKVDGSGSLVLVASAESKADSGSRASCADIVGASVCAEPVEEVISPTDEAMEIARTAPIPARSSGNPDAIGAARKNMRAIHRLIIAASDDSRRFP